MDVTPTAQAQRRTGHVWRFGDCELDELRNELRVRGAAVDVEAKPLEVLRQLLLHAREVVTKGELLEAAWPGVMVVDGSLATAVSKLRKALGDESMIITVPRVGYRLDVPVQIVSVTQPASVDLPFEEGDPVPGRDRWRLTRRLDRSPSSDVWLATHPKTREVRVFKFAPDATRLKALKREVTVARLLRETLGDHHEFVSVLEWNFDQPPYFVEFEYFGPNLAEWAAFEGGLVTIALERRLQMFLDAARAVAAAHDVGILHKDLKPGNILVASGPAGRPRIAVADFGSASLLAPARLGALGITNLGFTESSEDPHGGLAGTAVYVAPEVLAGQSPSTASDVYALGVLLYQFVVGDFRKSLAPGWESDVADPLVREDIAAAACGDPGRRLATAAELVARVADLDRRRVEREETASAQQREQRVASRRAATRQRRPWLLLAGAVAVAALAAGATLYRGASSLTPAVKTIAVLPFRNVGSDAAVDFLRFALADEVATVLSHIPGLSVRPFATTSRYDDLSADLQQAGREMRVGSVVTGRFARTPDQLHITLEAIDVGLNRVVWQDQIDAPAGSMIAAQVQIALRVRGGLGPAFGASGGNVPTQPRNEEAYHLFLRSVAHTLDPASNPEAVAMLERAVELDPAYPPAWLALARRYYVEGRYASGSGGIERYVAALERAAALDPDYVPAAAGLVISRVERGDLVAAYHTAADLVRRRPDSVDAHFALSYVLRFAGLLKESASHCDTAFLLDPKTATAGLRSCAIAFLHDGDYPRAMNYLNLDRGSEWAKAFSIHMLVRQGRAEEAVKIGSPGMPQWPSYEMLLACAQGRPSDEIARLAASVTPLGDPEATYLSAAHLAYCGQTTGALELLARAVEGKYCAYPAMETDPFFASVRAAQEFVAIREAASRCQADFLAQLSQGPAAGMVAR